jgi:hypothetical protein
MTARSRACDAAPRWPKRSLLRLWNAPTSPTPRQPNRRRIGFLRLHRGTSHSLYSVATLSPAASEVLLLIWEGQIPHGNQAHWGMDSTQQPFSNCRHHCEPSICCSTPLRSSIMAESLLHRGSGITTGSYRATGIERFNLSSSSHRALVSFARTLLLRSWPNISLPSGGRKAMNCSMTLAGSPDAILCAGSQSWGWPNLTGPQPSR